MALVKRSGGQEKPRKEVPRDDLKTVSLDTANCSVSVNPPNYRVAVIILLSKAARASGSQLTEGC